MVSSWSLQLDIWCSSVVYEHSSCSKFDELKAKDEPLLQCMESYEHLWKVWQVHVHGAKLLKRTIEKISL